MGVRMDRYEDIDKMETILNIRLNRETYQNYFETKLMHNVENLILREIKDKIISDLMNDEQFKRKMLKRIYKKLKKTI